MKLTTAQITRILAALERGEHPHPRELGATRYFSRIISLDLECPRCGRIHRIRRDNHHRLSAHGGVRASERQVPTWDPTTMRFRCQYCQKTFVLGVLAWDAPRGAGAGACPTDAVPNARQLAELRGDGDGWWMNYKAKGRIEANIAATDERPETDIDEEDIEEED